MRNELSIVLCGEAGQGIQTVENVLTRVLKLSGYHVFATKEYMSRVRGGCNSTSIRVSSKRLSAYVDRIDILVPLGKERTKHLNKRITKDTRILVEHEQIAVENKIYTNIAAVGVLSGVIGADKKVLSDYLSGYFSAKGAKTIEENQKAAGKGYELGINLASSGKFALKIDPDPKVKNEIMISGAEAIGLGALMGGCNFISAYPMTPSTGVFTFLAQNAAGLEIVSEQAEDEIAAINMAIGAWYAGARAMVTTSGGGYDLMQEGMSLAGMLETPVVVSLGMRPGPATGLPTRTEQGDLDLALYSGHGEFPRAIFAPGSLEQAVELSRRAFDTADKFQVPVFILSDQYLVDSYYNLPSIDIPKEPPKKYFIKTAKDYRRYELTENGLSPRGVPGFGEGLVAADSDEHDEEGHITEDLELRKRFVEKRMNKLKLLEEEALEPELIGEKNSRILIVGWGSNFGIIKEALSALGRNDISFLHFPQVYPLPKSTMGHLRLAKRVIAIENNARGQFAELIEKLTGIKITERILKYDGLPFSVEELVSRIKEKAGK